MVQANRPQHRSGDQGQTRQQLIDDTERWFQRRGLPGATPGRTSLPRVLNRAMPMLVLVLIAELLPIAIAGGGPGGALLGIAAIAMAGVVVLVVLVRRQSRRRWRLPPWLGVLVITLFLFWPAAMAATFNEPARLVVGLLMINLVVLIASLVAAYYNIPPVLRHEINEISAGKRNMLAPLRQILPMMMLFVLFLFMTAETWQVAHDATPLGYLVLVVAILGASAAFVASRTRTTFDGVSTFKSWNEIHKIAQSTTAPDLPLAHTAPEPPDLHHDAIGRNEVGLLVFVTMTVQLLAVMLVMGVTLAVLGALIIRRETIVQWTELEDVDWDPLVALTLFENEYAITRETLLTSTLLGAFAALQFAVSVASDDESQANYFGGVRADAREVLAVRARYTRFLAEGRRPPPAEGRRSTGATSSN